MANYELNIDNTNCPWKASQFDYGKGLIALHQEIEEFYKYMQLTDTELEMRMESIQRIKDIIYTIWPKVRVYVYGSERTGMQLPMSDIDLTIVGLSGSSSFIHELRKELIMCGIAAVNSITVLDKASVPVLKFTDKDTRLKFDICFNILTGIQAADLIMDFKREFPQMPKLVMVMKQFLSLQKLNNVYTGGISSYAITLMCTGFLQVHLRDSRCNRKNLGVLLLKLFNYYGRKFNYQKYGITVRNGCGFASRELLQSNFQLQWQSTLIIEDPIVPTNDVGRSSFAALYMKEAFESAYLKLSKIVDSGIRPNKKCSILGCILSIPNEVIEYRKWIHVKFEEKYRQAEQKIQETVITPKELDSINEHVNEPADYRKKYEMKERLY